MIQIKVSGFRNQTYEFEEPNQALLFLAGLKQEHSDHISPLIKNLSKPSIFYGPNCRKAKDENDSVYPTTLYRQALRAVTAKHPLKITMLEFDDDMSDLI